MPERWLGKVRSLAYSGRIVRISRRPAIYVYLGSGRDHVIVGGIYCSCEGFTRRAQRLEGCTHVFAVRLAASEGRIASVELPPRLAARIVWEVLTGGLTRTLRETIYRRGLEEDVG